MEYREHQAEARVCRGLLRIMLDLQTVFDLPVEVVCQGADEGLVPVVLRYAGDDDGLLDWFQQTAENIYNINHEMTIDNG